MGLLEEKDKKYLKDMFNEKLVDEVKLVFFSNETNCQYCSEIRMLLNDVKELTDKLSISELNFYEEKEKVSEYKLHDSPVIVFLNSNSEDTGIRFYGIPSGYEFQTFIEDIVMVSSGKHQLSEKSVEIINKSITQPTEINVFVTPTCPYCPKAAYLAHQIAFINKNVIANIIESMEFPKWADRYNVYGVPKSIVNDAVEFEGAVPEKVFVKQVIEGAKTPLKDKSSLIIQ